MPVAREIDSSAGISQGKKPTSENAGMTVFALDPLSDPRWKAFTEFHPDSSVFHRVEWLAALQSCYGYTPIVFSLSRPEHRLENAFVACQIRSALTGRRLVSLPFSDHCEPLVSHSREFGQLLSDLKEMVARDHLKYVEIRPIRHVLGDQYGKNQADLGISHSYYLHTLDIRPPEQVLLKSFHKDSIQRKIRRAERDSLRYEESSGDSLLGDFFRLMTMTRKRQGLPPQPLKWFRSLTTSFGNDLKIRVARKGEIAVASILTISAKKVLVYKYGCSDSRFNNLGGMPMLFWRAIQDAKARGLEWLDMGRSDIDNTGLIAFKEHWGAKRMTINYWRYPVRAASFAPESLVKHAKKVISRAPEMSLVMLGNLFYRHIG